MRLEHQSAKARPGTKARRRGREGKGREAGEAGRGGEGNTVQDRLQAQAKSEQELRNIMNQLLLEEPVLEGRNATRCQNPPKAHLERGQKDKATLINGIEASPEPENTTPNKPRLNTWQPLSQAGGRSPQKAGGKPAHQGRGGDKPATTKGAGDQPHKRRRDRD